MKHIETHLEENRSLDELIEAHLQALFDKLSRPHNIEEIEASLATLSDMVQSYKLRDEMLERLLDSTTPEDSRIQIVERLQALHIIVANNQAEAERLHAKSHQLMERSMLLIQKVQEQIKKREG